MSKNHQNEQPRDPEEKPEEKPEEQQEDEKPDFNELMNELLKKAHSGKLRCPKCGFTSDSLSILGQHWRLVHGGY
jgi:predicted RNA-binding protein with RPS1 domain